jgi:NitT/TauT family transport system substrate-binding protein
MPLRIMVSRHSAFYSPLIATLARDFLRDAGLEATYDVLQPGQRSQVLIRDGIVDIMQSAVSSNWRLIEAGETPRPVHFAQINRRDGFFLAGRQPDPEFDWKKLEGATLLADHGLQPLVMLKYAVHHNGADWTRIRVVDAGSPEQMEGAFRAGQGDYVHLQAPAPHQIAQGGKGFVVVSVGRSMPEVAFSSLCASAEFLESDRARAFLQAYGRARKWVREAPPAEIAACEVNFFPGTDPSVLAKAIEEYQGLGCWEGGLEIPEDLYEQALNVFEHAGEVRARYPYGEVVQRPTSHRA